MVNIGGTFINPWSIHTTMTLFIPTPLVFYAFDSINFSLAGLLSPFSFFMFFIWLFFCFLSMFYFSVDPCTMWQMWINKWHIVSALILFAFPFCLMSFALLTPLVLLCWSLVFFLVFLSFYVWLFFCSTIYVIFGYWNLQVLCRFVLKSSDCWVSLRVHCSIVVYFRIGAVIRVSR